jgi:hypothetical protein
MKKDDPFGNLPRRALFAPKQRETGKVSPKAARETGEVSRLKARIAELEAELIQTRTAIGLPPIAPWVAAGVSKATWYRRQKRSPNPQAQDTPA